MLPGDQESRHSEGTGAEAVIEALSKVTFRIIVDTPRDGRWNMAADEALMEYAGTPGALPVLRFYAFSPPTLSVGRFQATSGVFDFDALERDGITFVRRPSGGQAVLHDQELTYSAVAGRHLVGGLSKREFYRFIVPILLAGLDRLAVHGFAADGGAGSNNPDCFASTGEYEIKGSGGRKLIGSAQMVSRHAVLQHGSIPLGPSNRRIRAYILSGAEENTSSSLSEETGRAVTFREAADAFSQTAGALLAAVPSEPTADELSRAVALLRQRYEKSAWNRKY